MLELWLACTTGAGLLAAARPHAAPARVPINQPPLLLPTNPRRCRPTRPIRPPQNLNVPYLVSLPLVFQTTEEWLDSELGVHPVQVALQVRRHFFEGGSGSFLAARQRAEAAGWVTG